MTIGSEEYIKTSLKMKEIESVIKDQERAVKDLGDSWKNVRMKMADISNMIMGFQSVFEMFDSGIGKLKDFAADAAKLDDVYADVQKTTGLTHEEVEKLNEAFKKMDTRTSREQLNQLAYEAGKLGISSAEQVAQFVSASDKINIALGDVLGEGAMVKIGKLSDVYAKSTQQLADAGDDLEAKMLKIGSAVNMLGQSSTANEGYLVEFLSRMGGIATQANLSADSILGFASALDQDMQKQEMSATAFQKFIMQIIKKPAEFAAAARMEVRDFTALMQSDMNEALLKVLEGFQGEGGLVSLQPIFEDLGLDAARAASVISSMANSVDKIREAQAIANEELITGASVINEFNTKNNTMQAQAEKAKKAFEDVRIELGNELYPIVVHMTKAGTGLTKMLAGLVKYMKNNQIVIWGVVASLIAWNEAKIRMMLLAAKDWVLKKREILQIKAQATAEAWRNVQIARNTLAVEKNRLALMKLELEEQKELVAKLRLSTSYADLTAKAMAEGRVIQLETAIKQKEIAVTKSATAVNKAFSTALKSTPWGLILSVATMAVAAISSFSDKTNTAISAAEEWKSHLREADAEALANSKKVKFELDNQIRSIKEIIEKRGDERTKVAELNRTYGSIFGTYGTLAKWYDVLTKKSNSYTKALYLQAKVNQNLEDVVTLEKELERIKKMSVEDFAGEKGLQTSGGVLDYLVGFISATTKGVITGIEDVISYQRPLETFIEDINSEFDWYTSGLFTAEAGIQQREEINRILMDLNVAYKEYNKNSKELQKITEENNLNIENATAVPSTTPTNTITPEQEKARKAQEAWERFSESYQRLMEKLDAKTQTGLAKTFADVDVIIKKMEDDLKAAADKHPEANQWLADLKAKAEEWKQAEMEKYIAKANKELAKFVKTGEKSDIEAVNKLTNEFERLQSEIAQADEKIKQYEADLQNPDVPEAVKKQLAGIIEKYRETISKTRTDLIKTVSAEMPDISSFLASDSGPENKEKRLKALNEEYEKNVRLIEEAWERNNGLLEVLQTQIALERDKNEVDKDPAVIDALDKQVEAVNAQNAELEKQKKALDEVNENKKKAIDTDEWVKSFQKVTESIRTFADAAIESLQSINDILDNQSNKRIKDAENEKDDKIKILDEQLENNLISQEEYEARKQKIEDEYNDYREQEELEQFRRQKAMSLAQAHMSAALAVIQVWADSTLATWAKIAMSAVAATNVALQTAAILSEPEPYAKGGYVPRDTVFRAGEAGEEWVASNQLLTDPTTAPVIDALEQYQHGDRSVLARLPFARVNTANAATAAATIDRKLSATRTMAEGGNRMEALLQDLCGYMKDPNNRRAVISRDYQQTYERNENFLRSVAKLG